MPLDPTSIATLKLWVRPEGLSALNDGDAIATWTDESASAKNMTQSNGAQKPVCKTNIVNGFRVARFDGSDDYMATAAFTWVDGSGLFTVFAVSKRISGSLASIVDSDGGTRIFQHRYNGTDFEAISFNTLGTPFTDTEPDTAANFNVLTMHRDSAAVTALVNGTSAASTSETGTATSASQALVLGSHFAGDQFGNIDIAEVLVYSGALSSANRIKVEVYLGAKYKIAGARGPGIVVPSRCSRDVHTRR